VSLSFARQVREWLDPRRSFTTSARDVLRELG
jgi:hypothetical protein